jgi:hypothetical protein
MFEYRVLYEEGSNWKLEEFYTEELHNLKTSSGIRVKR